jgi:hypothetical protein
MVHLLLRPQYLQAAGLRAEPGSLLFPARSPETPENYPAGRSRARRRHAQAPAETS